MRFLRRSEKRLRSNEGWLITAASRACADINRRYQRDEEHRSSVTAWDTCFTRDEDERFSDNGAHDPHRLTVEHLTINALLRQLDHRERIVVTHLYLLGADSQQLARYLNVTPNHLRQIAFRARRHARLILGELEEEPASR